METSKEMGHKHSATTSLRTQICPHGHGSFPGAFPVASHKSGEALVPSVIKPGTATHSPDMSTLNQEKVFLKNFFSYKRKL